jgi:hypothetical protein
MNAITPPSALASGSSIGLSASRHRLVCASAYSPVPARVLHLGRDRHANGLSSAATAVFANCGLRSKRQLVVTARSSAGRVSATGR